MAVIVPFESPQNASIEPLVGLVAADMERVNAAILARTGSEVTMIPEVANHLISSGGKRLRPMLTLAMAQLAEDAYDQSSKDAVAEGWHAFTAAELGIKAKGSGSVRYSFEDGVYQGDTAQSSEGQALVLTREGVRHHELAELFDEAMVAAEVVVALGCR